MLLFPVCPILINLNTETSSFFITGGRYDDEKSLISGSSQVLREFDSVAVKNTSCACTIRLLAKFELPARASIETHLNIFS